MLRQESSGKAPRKYKAGSSYLDFSLSRKRVIRLCATPPRLPFTSWQVQIERSPAPRDDSLASLVPFSLHKSPNVDDEERNFEDHGVVGAGWSKSRKGDDVFSPLRVLVRLAPQATNCFKESTAARVFRLLN